MNWKNVVTVLADLEAVVRFFWNTLVALRFLVPPSTPTINVLGIISNALATCKSLSVRSLFVFLRGLPLTPLVLGDFRPPPTRLFYVALKQHVV